MDIIKRSLLEIILSSLKNNKVYIILGARRVGKTILLKEVIKNRQGKILILNAEDTITAQVLSDKSITNYKRLVAGYELLIIDEAQVLPDIGKILKLMVDEIEGLKIIVSGSSTFDLMNMSGEPLVGRSYVYYLYPFSQSELSNVETYIQTAQNLEDRLIYGSYPEVLQIENPRDKQDYLSNIVNSYLLKDILAIDGIRNSAKINSLLKLIAFQTGKELSYNELGNQLGMSKNTIEKYLDLLSKVFVLFKLGAYSKNLRREVNKSQKWYFVDNGIRNAVISNYNPISIRQDIGDLWENYLISERIKRNSYGQKTVNYYFWRTYDQQEIDLIEEYNSEVKAYEIKWRKSKFKIPIAWQNNYSDIMVELINKENYLDFII